jgi:L-histidine N-alpha-methyltransferase
MTRKPVGAHPEGASVAGIKIENYLNGDGFFAHMAEDVREGLLSTPKTLPPKYFYDEAGSDLFERITEQPEYYPMREEGKLLASIADELMASLRPVQVVELGSGSSTKTRALLDAGREDGSLQSYVAFDVSESIIVEAGETLGERYPGLALHGIVGDFQRHLDTLPAATGRRLVLFLGSTIGNLYRDQRIELLRQIRDILGPEDYLLLGTDLVKDTSIVVPAYNDAAGVTAAFNRNMLSSINRGLDGDFDPEAFEHEAFFNHDEARIEMHLRPRTKQIAKLRAINLEVVVTPDETIWTECSHKFTRASVSEMLVAAGLQLREWYAASGDMFGLSLSCRA